MVDVRVTYSFRMLFVGHEEKKVNRSSFIADLILLKFVTCERNVRNNKLSKVIYCLFFLFMTKHERKRNVTDFSRTWLFLLAKSVST